MKKIYKIIFAMSFVLTFLIGIIVGFGFIKKTTILGKEELQEYIYEQTASIKVALQKEGFKVNQSHIIGTLWITCSRLRDFILLAKITNTTQIYIHWKIDFLNQPVFFILINATAIIYEPF